MERGKGVVSDCIGMSPFIYLLCLSYGIVIIMHTGDARSCMVNPAYKTGNVGVVEKVEIYFRAPLAFNWRL
jgi:hypothetical protein